MIFDNCQMIEMRQLTVTSRSRNNTKKVLCITTGESYDSIIKAAQDCGMSESAIGGACRRPAGKNYAGFLCEGKVKMIKNNNCKLERVFWSYL